MTRRFITRPWDSRDAANVSDTRVLDEIRAAARKTTFHGSYGCQRTGEDGIIPRPMASKILGDADADAPLVASLWLHDGIVSGKRCV